MLSEVLIDSCALANTAVEYLDLFDYFHQLDASVAGGLSPPTLFSRGALASLGPLVPTPLVSSQVVLK